MALNLNKNLKLYYSIKEVAEMFELNESTLRYWEQEFPFLKPKTSGAAKVRQYQEKDIEQIRLIHNLVKVRGFKLSAARKILTQNRKGADTKADVLERLIEVRSELQALKKQLSHLQIRVSDLFLGGLPLRHAVGSDFLSILPVHMCFPFHAE